MAIKRLNLNLDLELVKDLDDYAAKLHINRSAACSAALSQFFTQLKAIDALNSISRQIDNGQLSIQNSNEEH